MELDSSSQGESTRALTLRSGRLVNRYKRARTESTSADSTAVSVPMETQTETRSVGTQRGPSYTKRTKANWWKVPKSQYNKLKEHILSKGAGRTRYRRYGSGRAYSSGQYDGHLGPIVITGRGGYWTDKLKSGASAAYRSFKRALPEGSFSRFGRAAGGAMFGAPGAEIGGILGQGIANVAGYGDYTIRKNALLSVDEGQDVASFGDLNHGIVICHREYLGDISVPANPAAFTIQSFPVNPGWHQSFPWLSQIASNFDQYEIQGMLYHFKSTSSDFGTLNSLAMGTVILATDYDTAESNYSSKIEMENAQYSTSCKPSVDCIHAIECDPSISFSPLKYVRTGSVPSGKDIRLYDHANFQIATVGLPFGASGVIGELWCTYKIAFFKPQMSGGSNVLTDLYLTNGAGVDNSNPLGTATANGLTYSSIGGTISGTRYTFPQNIMIGSKYLINYSVVGSSTALNTAMVVSYTGATITFSRVQPAGVTSTTLWHIANIVITAPVAYIDFNGAAHSSPGSPNSLQLLVTQLDRDHTY